MIKSKPNSGDTHRNGQIKEEQKVIFTGTGEKDQVFFSHRGSSQPAVLVLRAVHVSVESVQLPVTQVIHVHEVELPAGVMITLIVADSGKIQPFRMAKFIACN